MRLINVFPIAVGSYELGREFADEELNFLEKQEWVNHIGNTGCVATDLLDHQEFANLRLFVEESLKDYLSLTLNPVDDNEIYITQSWASITKPGQFHHGHVHPNSFVSGVLYVNAEGGKDSIVFTNEREYKRIKLEIKEATAYNSAQLVQLKTGDLLLFPSELEHLVEPTTSNSDRISVSFNTFVRGNIGYKNSYAELKL